MFVNYSATNKDLKTKDVVANQSIDSFVVS